MIIRRITEHLRKQDWIAVSLDLVVVIVGIFVGMQVSDWNDERKQTQEGLYHLNSLAVFLEKDIADRAIEIENSNAHKDNTGDAWSILLAPVSQDGDKDRFERSLMSAYFFWGPKSKPAPLQRIIGGGKLDMIRSRPIQEALLAFDSMYDEAIHQTNISYGYSKDITLAIINQIEYQPRGGILSPLEELKQNKELKSALRSKTIFQRIQIDTLQTVQGASQDLLDTLNVYLAQFEKRE